MGELEMLKMLNDLPWLLELDSLEKARMYEDQVRFIRKLEKNCLFAILLCSSIYFTIINF